MTTENKNIAVTDMDKINELNSCRQNRKTESILLDDTHIKEEVQYDLSNGKSFENMVKSKVITGNHNWQRKKQTFVVEKLTKTVKFDINALNQHGSK